MRNEHITPRSIDRQAFGLDADLLGPEVTWHCPECGTEVTSRHLIRADEATHIPTPDELDDLMADISATGYASEAVQVVEDWTRKWWGVESGDTTRWSK